MRIIVNLFYYGLSTLVWKQVDCFQIYPRISACCQSTRIARPSASLHYMSMDDVEDKEEKALARLRRRRRRGYDDQEEETEFSDDDRYYDDTSVFDEEAIDDEFDDWDEDESDDEEEYDLFGNEIIPNPLLDSIDPDGAAERFPELARDPRFWFDMVLFIAFLNFLSDIGPRDPFPDIPLY